MVKNVNSELEIKHIKKISEDHQFEDDAIAQFEKIQNAKQQDAIFFILQISCDMVQAQMHLDH